MKTSTFYIRLALIGIVILGGAYFIGTSDSGEINVTDTIQASNDANEANGDGSVENVANVPDAFRNMPNGGLVPQGSQSALAPAQEESISPSDEATTSVEADGEVTSN